MRDIKNAQVMRQEKEWTEQSIPYPVPKACNFDLGIHHPLCRE